jgi:plastocyanin
MQPTINRTTNIGFSFHRLFLILGFVFMSGGIAQAQQPTPTNLPDNRFDTYPNPFSRGALEYSLGDKWDKTNLTYYFDNCPRNIDCNVAQKTIRDAMAGWARYTPLTFNPASSAYNADIEFRWSTQGPELGQIGDVLAYATFPHDGGDVTFDDAEPWTSEDGGDFDLFLVAQHELGHALGLNHTNKPNALMYPVLNPSVHGLTEDDVAGIQALYGGPNQQPQQPPPVNNFPQNPGASTDQVSGQISDQTPYDTWEVEAEAGETVTFTMTPTSGNLAPYIGILANDEQTVLAESNPVQNGQSAQVTYTFPQAGRYIIVATREGVRDGNTSGSYTLSFNSNANSQPNPPAANPPQSGNTLVTIRTYNPSPLCEIHFRGAGSGNWGGNYLPRQVTNGNYVDIGLPSAGTYDVQVVTCNGQAFEQDKLTITPDAVIEVYDNQLNVVS